MCCKQNHCGVQVQVAFNALNEGFSSTLADSAIGEIYSCAPSLSVFSTSLHALTVSRKYHTVAMNGHHSCHVLLLVFVKLSLFMDRIPSSYISLCSWSYCKSNNYILKTTNNYNNFNNY